jgi:hypothetical protein
MKTLYDRLVSLGTKFQTPLTNAGEQFQGKRGPLDYMYVFGHKRRADRAVHDRKHRVPPHAPLAAEPQKASEWYLKYFGVPNTPERRGPQGIWNRRPEPHHGQPPTRRSRPPRSRAGRRSKRPAAGCWIISRSRWTIWTRRSRRLQQDGVKVLQPPQTIIGGAIRSAFVMAPDNVQLELVQTNASRVMKKGR